MDFWIRTIPSVLEEDEETGWKVYMLFRGSSPLLKSLSCHVAVLSEGKMIHPLHQHQEEELILIFSGEVDNVVVEGDLPLVEKMNRLKKGALIYLADQQPHTLRAVGPGPATILVFKWEGNSCNTQGNLPNTVIVDPSEGSGLPHLPFLPGSPLTRLFEMPTRYLQKLSVRIVELEPGPDLGCTETAMTWPLSCSVGIWTRWVCNCKSPRHSLSQAARHIGCGIPAKHLHLFSF